MEGIDRGKKFERGESCSRVLSRRLEVQFEKRASLFHYFIIYLFHFFTINLFHYFFISLFLYFIRPEQRRLNFHLKFFFHCIFFRKRITTFMNKSLWFMFFFQKSKTIAISQLESYFWFSCQFKLVCTYGSQTWSIFNF